MPQVKTSFAQDNILFSSLLNKERTKGKLNTEKTIKQARSFASYFICVLNVNWSPV